MTKHKTNEEFVKEIYDLVGSEYTLLSKYTRSNDKVKIRHNECGFEYMVVPSRFKSGNRCRKCNGVNQRKTNEDFVLEVRELVGDEYTFLEKYSTAIEKIEIRHNICNSTYYVSPNNFLRGNRCAKCREISRIKKSTKSNGKFLDEVYELVEDEYTFIDEYINTETRILCRHNMCDYEWKVKPSNFLNGTRCPKCSRKVANNKHMLSQDEFEKRVSDIVGNEYKILGKYKGHRGYVAVKHNTCGREYYVTANNLLRGKGCANCATSKGEKAVRKYLMKNNISFEEEQTFEGLKYINLLRYDFAIYDYKGKLNSLIEFDGLQHTKPVELFGGEKYFKLSQKRDSIKDKYAKDNNIPLLRIPYEDLNDVDDILNNWFEKINKIGEIEY